MSLLDKVIAEVTPEPTEEDKLEARRKLRASGQTVPWIGLVCDHHDRIDAAFVAVRSATSAAAQRAAQKELAQLLTGHSMAEEAVLYPAMALGDQKSHATSAYTQQSAAKVQTAALDELEPLSKDYMEKLEHLRAAVTHHVHAEETSWFPKLRDEGSVAVHAKLSARYAEECDAYFGKDAWV